MRLKEDPPHLIPSPNSHREQQYIRKSDRLFLKFCFFPLDSKTAMQFGRVRIGTSFVVVITRFGKNFKLDIWLSNECKVVVVDARWAKQCGNGSPFDILLLRSIYYFYYYYYYYSSSFFKGHFLRESFKFCGQLASSGWTLLVTS
jgi:hypothetical protein